MSHRRYKVVHLLEWCELGGGLEMITGAIAAGLNQQVFDVEIWCLHRGGKLVEEFRQRGLKVRVLDIPTYHNPINIVKLAALFRKEKVDILHTHVYFAATIGRIAAKLAGVRCCINHVHSSYWHYSKLNLLMERVLSAWTFKIICVSQSVCRFVTDHEKINPSKTTVIYNGITCQRVESARDQGTFVITIVASLYVNKGHHILLQAIARLVKEFPHIRCWIVGEGERGTALIQQAKELGITQHVVFWGVRWDVAEILSKSDVFVLSSIHREGLPVSILEAMACGLPVIATTIGGIPEVVTNGDNGILVAPENPDVMADAITKLIKDENLRKRLAIHALETFNKRFKSEIMVSQIEDLYRKAMAK